MSTATLTSLAMLKVTIDHGGDYLDYLVPFALQILVDHHPDRVTDQIVRKHILEDYGLDIPNRTIQIVLKRISKKHSLKKEDGVYHITGDLKDPDIARKKNQYIRYVDAVILELIEFSKETSKPIIDKSHAVSALCAFLSKFDISCLRAYLRGTTIPSINDQSDFDIALVSQYVLYLQERQPGLFESFLFMVQGHMLANALLCPDLKDAPREYKGLTFYLDTPLLIQRLGLEGEHKQETMKELISLLNNLDATVATFSHSLAELKSVISGAAKYLNSPGARGAIITESRRRNTTKSDLLLQEKSADKDIKEAEIEIHDTPEYIDDFQIDELAFDQVIDEELSYINPRAKEYDINSVRCIYVLREGKSPQSLEKSVAILVTSNSKLSDAAWKYGQKHKASYEVSSVIPSFSLANIAWLKAPMGALSLPAHEVLAFSYAALQPKKSLLSKYLKEIDKLERKGKISALDHQLLRSETLAQDELMKQTLGDEDELVDDTVVEIARRVSDKIKSEESNKLNTEQEAHRRTQNELNTEKERNQKFEKILYWQCRRKAKILSWCTSGIISILVLSGFFMSIVQFQPNNSVSHWTTVVCLGAFFLLASGSLIFGSSIKNLHQRMQDIYLAWFINRKPKVDGL